MVATTRNMTFARSGFVGLPAELHDMVCSFVPDAKALKNIRDTCQALHRKTDEVWQKRKFSTLEVNFTIRDLKYVLKVSKHPRYSPLVQKLVIRPGFLNKSVCRDGDDGRLLEAALENLKHLQGIEILPYQTAAMFRASANAKVPAVGDPNYNPHITLRYDPTLVHDPISHAFLVVREALRKSDSVTHFKAGATPPSTLERNSVDHAVFQASTAGTSLARLESFHLVAGAYGSSLNIELSLANLLHPMQALKSLRLEFWGYNVEWLSNTFENVTIPHLQELQIQAARQVRATSLKDFIQRHKGTLECLDLNLITFEDDELDKAFPGTFEGHGLHKLKLSQLCSARHGLLLLGTTNELICGACYKDLDATWQFKTGPHCVHASVDVTSGELAVSRELEQRLKVVDLLPWPQRPPPPVMFPATVEAAVDEVQDHIDWEAEDMQDQEGGVPLVDSSTMPTIASSSAGFANLASFLPPAYISGENANPSTRQVWVPPSMRSLQTQFDPSTSLTSAGDEVIELTDEFPDDGPYDGYDDYSTKDDQDIAPKNRVLPVAPYVEDEDDDDLIDVSGPFERLRKRAGSPQMPMVSPPRKLKLKVRARE